MRPVSRLLPSVHRLHSGRFLREISTDIAKASSRIQASDQERREIIESMLRVDHAGEFGAVRIYEGQVRLF